MRVVAIIQARMGSTRLPGKCLADIAGQSMLERVVRRTQQARQLDDVVVATSTAEDDQAIVRECERLCVPCVCGSEQDVLDRYLQAARASHADVVVRITSDCPLIDPGEIDRVVDALLTGQAVYAANTLQRTLPRGLDAEAFYLSALQQAHRDATEPYQRVHVTPYLREHPDRFAQAGVTGKEDLSQWRWTVDTAEDLAFVRAVYDAIEGRNDLPWPEVLACVSEHPELAEINRHIRQKHLEEG